jgi:uncharacterized coiled-coil protein SlyX
LWRKIRHWEAQQNLRFWDLVARYPRSKTIGYYRYYTYLENIFRDRSDPIFDRTVSFVYDHRFDDCVVPIGPRETGKLALPVYDCSERVTLLGQQNQISKLDSELAATKKILAASQAEFTALQTKLEEFKSDRACLMRLRIEDSLKREKISQLEELVELRSTCDKSVEATCARMARLSVTDTDLWVLRKGSPSDETSPILTRIIREQKETLSTQQQTIVELTKVAQRRSADYFRNQHDFLEVTSSVTSRNIAKLMRSYRDGVEAIGPIRFYELITRLSDDMTLLRNPRFAAVFQVAVAQMLDLAALTNQTALEILGKPDRLTDRLRRR